MGLGCGLSEVDRVFILPELLVRTAVCRDALGHPIVL